MTETTNSASVSHTETGKDSPNGSPKDSPKPDFGLIACEFIGANDVWTGDRDYKRLGKALAKLLEEAYEHGRGSMVRAIVRNAIEERSRFAAERTKK